MNRLEFFKSLFIAPLVVNKVIKADKHKEAGACPQCGSKNLLFEKKTDPSFPFHTTAILVFVGNKERRNTNVCLDCGNAFGVKPEEAS